MYLIRRKEDNLIQYAFSERPRMGNFLKHPVLALDIRSDTHEIIETKDIPDDFTPGAYEYDETWKVKNQQLIDAAKAEKEKPAPLNEKQAALSELSEVTASLKGKTNSLANLLARIEALEKLVKTLI